jgi:hypothetical protein
MNELLSRKRKRTISPFDARLNYRRLRLAELRFETAAGRRNCDVASRGSRLYADHPLLEIATTSTERML